MTRHGNATPLNTSAGRHVSNLTKIGITEVLYSASLFASAHCRACHIGILNRAFTAAADGAQRRGPEIACPVSPSNACGRTSNGTPRSRGTASSPALWTERRIAMTSPILRETA